MNITITPTLLSGAIRPPASKSQAHRLIIAAALAEGESLISGVNMSRDIAATLDCMGALGARELREDETTLRITGVPGTREAEGLMDCGESGSTLRFLIPVALALKGRGRFRGHGRLMQRPQGPYFDIFREKGIRWTAAGDTLEIEGVLTPGDYRLPGNVSSQFITGLMYALPLLEGNSRILLTTPLESSGYVDMTLEALARFGITVLPMEDGWQIPGNQRYIPGAYTVEADFSQAAFFRAMKGMGCAVSIRGMNPESAQGDRVMIPYMDRMDLPGEVVLDVRECPDLVPPLAARAALRPGEITRIVNAARLRIKESDRLRSVSAVLSALGAEVEELADGLVIRGRNTLPGGVTVDSWNDHRIAMMAAVAATKCLAPVTVTGAECVEKSYPTFWQDYVRLGGRITED